MQKIPVYKKGQIVATALVDDENYEEIVQYRWRLHTGGYAVRSMREGGKPLAILMHRQIMRLGHSLGKAGRHPEIHHRDHNKLNNQKDNLVITSREENLQHRDPKKRGSVYWHSRDKAWVAKVRLHGKYIWLGTYPSEKEAHDALSTWRTDL